MSIGVSNLVLKTHRQDWKEDASYSGLSPTSEFQNFSEPESPFGDPLQAYFSDHSAYKNISVETPKPEQFVNLSQLVGPSNAQGVSQSLSIEPVAPRSAKASLPSSSNSSKKDESDEDDLSYPSSSDYFPSPSPRPESKRSIRHHPYSTVNRPKAVSEASGTPFRTILSRTRADSDRPCAPVPVPVPNLTKKSRGRKVPTIHDSDFDGAVDEYVPGGLRGTADGGKVKRSRGGGATGAKGARTYKCTVEDCGKCFVRGEHLKRHIRSIHTNEKRQCFSLFVVLLFDDVNQRYDFAAHPCPYEGCDRTFSRRDNLGQHQRVHGM